MKTLRQIGQHKFSVVPLEHILGNETKKLKAQYV